MFSKKEKIGTTLSLILSLCLMLTGVFFGLPAIGSFAAGEDVHYGGAGSTPTTFYTGSEIRPTVTVLDGEYIVPDSEYEVAYANNTNIGTATVTITDVPGGNYDVNGEENFKIISSSAGVMFNTEPESVMTPGATIHSSDFKGYFYKINAGSGAQETDDVLGSFGDINGNPATSVHLVEASVWDSNEVRQDDIVDGTITNETTGESYLVESLKIPESYAEPSYPYYVIIKNEGIPDNEHGGEGYYAYAKSVSTSENGIIFDTNIWYKTNESQSVNATWYYKLDGAGNIIGLYTLDKNINSLIDSNGCLNIPEKVADHTVIGIGGYDENLAKALNENEIEKPTIYDSSIESNVEVLSPELYGWAQVVPSANGGWTSLSLPNTVTTINNYAFCKTQAPADIVIPSTVTKIGEQAFYKSKIKSVKISDMTGTIASSAFAKLDMGGLPRDRKIYVKGGSGGLLVSRVAFADTNATSITIRGKVDIHEQAFRNSTNAAEITIGGDVDLGTSVFVNATALTDLRFSGSIKIGNSAFKNATALTSVYLPSGVDLENAYDAFNGADHLTTLESNTDLGSGSFNNTGAISVLILGPDVARVRYDWEGCMSSVAGNDEAPGRKIYVRNPSTKFEAHKENGTYSSAYGSSGYVLVRYTNTNSGSGVIKTLDRPEEGKETVEADSTSYLADQGNYYIYYKGSAGTVNLMDARAENDGKANATDRMIADGIDSVQMRETERVQTGIEAYYSGKILTTRDIDKDKMTVLRIFGNDEGAPYSSNEFYVVRAEEYNTESNKDGGVTEAAIADYEPVNAKATDLDTGKKTGTIATMVVVFYDVPTGELDSEGHEITRRECYNFPVSIRVEEYTPKSYIEQEYGSYDAIAARLTALDEQIAALSEALGATAGSTEEIEKLKTEIANLKTSYAEAVNALKAYTQSYELSENSRYIGIDKETGEEVIFIKGNPTVYEKVVDTNGDPVTDSKGNEIYKVEYDTDDNGETETIYVIVKEDGVYQVTPVFDEHDNTTVIGVNPTDNAWKDTLADLQRQMTAELAAMQAKINSLSSMLNNITNTINENTGEITIDPTLPIDKQTKAIINEINSLYTKARQLKEIRDNGGYTGALDAIYNKLTGGEKFTPKELNSLEGVLAKINNEIDAREEELEIQKATLDDLQAQLSNAEENAAALQQKIDENNTAIADKDQEIKDAQADLKNLQDALNDPERSAEYEDIERQITEKNAEIAKLNEEKAALSAKADTLAQAQDTLNSLQNLKNDIADKNRQIADLQAEVRAAGATTEAYSETVRTAHEVLGKTDDASISAAIRSYVNANATITKIQQAVSSTNNGDALVADVNAAIANAGIGSGSGTAVPDEATLTAKYNEGYAAGLAASTTATEKEKLDAEYTKGYNAGYAAAPKSSSTDTASLTAKYNEGYNAGVSSVNTTSYYNNGYNAGYTAGLKAGSGTGNTELTTQVTSLTSQVTSLTTENTKLAGQISTLKTDNAALKTELDTLKNDNTELSGKVGELTTNNTELTGKVDDLTGKNQSLSGQVNDLTTRNNDLAGQITSLNGQVATLKANNNRTTNTGTGNTGNTATNTANTNASSNTNTGTNTTRPTDVTSAANTNNGTTNNGTTAPTANNQGTTGRTSGTSATSAATSSAGRTSATSSATSASPLYGNYNSTPLTEGSAKSIKITQFENAGTAPASGQVATVNLVKLANADTKGIKTNAMKSAPITDADKEEAEIVINYYMNHLSELGNLGSTEISNAAKDDTKDVAFNEVLAADFTASDAQNKEITEKGKTSLTIASDDIVNGGTYLAIHKSNKRSGMYDVLLTKASGNEIAMTLQDLSPVTIVKVSVAPIGGTAAVADRSVTEAAPAKNMSKLWIAIGICAAVVGAFIFFMVLIKMRRKKRDRMEPAYAGDGNGDFEEVDDQYEDDYEDDPEPYDEPNQG